jgi:formate hydrogenlyase subunit 4
LFGTTICVASFVPLVQPSALLASRGDFFLFVYLLAMGRFFLSLGGFDGGSSFGGMGASREALVSSLAEAPFLLSLVAVAILASHADIAGMVAWTMQQNIFNISAVHILAFTSLAMVVIAETGRMPVDNPTTHLELTMIHEGMVLEYSGPRLALIEWASAVKLHAMLALLVALFVPWGMASSVSVGAIGLALILYCAKAAPLMVLLAVIESGMAKLRMYLVPDFLGVASAVSALAVIFTILVKR